jgi:hypothetical protein
MQPVESQPTVTTACFMLVSCLAFSLTLKIEVTRFSEMSADFQCTAMQNILEDRIFHNHRCDKFKLYNQISVFVQELTKWMSGIT